MTLSRRTPAALLESLAVVVTGALVLAVPSIYFATHLQFERGTLANLAATRAYLIEQRISANPLLWQFEEHRLVEFVDRGMLGNDGDDHRALLDVEHRVIVESKSAEVLRTPAIQFEVPLHDAGRVVGHFVIERSLRPLLLATLFIAFVSALLGGAVLLGLKFLPLRSLRRAEADLRHKAFHDNLTGLPNRDAFRLRLSEAVRRAESQGSQVAVLFIDLDHFKGVNDSLGHDAGDSVLRDVADRLRKSVRSTDTVARLSGDEFAVVVEHLGLPEEAAQVADKLIERFKTPFLAAGRDFHLTCSVGLAMFPQHARDPDKLLAFADTAMLHAKGAGRNAHQFYDDSMQQSVENRLRLQSDLRGALERGEFLLHYQPLYDMAHGRPCGAEALLRWQHPERGVVPPVEFIGVLEDIGLIHAVGAWVLHEACQQAARWLSAGLEPMRVAVNVSPRQFARGHDLVADVRHALEASGLRPDCLQLELTEGLLMTHNEHSVEVLNALKTLGVTVAIDDFGTGYSSLAYLRQFAVDTLKIDRSFVRDMGEDLQEASIVKAIIQLGHGLGLSVTAEGIETAAQRSALRSLGCDTGQGYLLGRPMPAVEFTAHALAAHSGGAVASALAVRVDRADSATAG